MPRAALAVAILVGGLLLLAAPAAAQAVPSDEPTLGMLASTAGLSVVIGLVMQLLRGPMGASFDQWAPALAVVIGIVLAEAYVVVTGPLTGESILQAALIGLVAGILSQNVNTVIRRSIAPPPG